MKFGDTVRIHDGSYSLVLQGDKLEHIGGYILKKDIYSVLAVGHDFPTHGGYSIGDGSNNDLLLVSRNDPSRYVYTQQRFCTVVPASNLAEITVRVPKGTKVIVEEVD